MLITESHTTAELAPQLNLEARLAAVDAAMTVRLEEVMLAVDINSAHIDLPTVDLADVIRIPVAVPQTPMTGSSAPVADLLLRAQARVLAPGGWGHGASNCLESAIQMEARSGRDEQAARNLIRRAAGSGDPLPHINLQLASASQAGQLLGTAARLAEKAGL